MERPYILHMFTPGPRMSPFDINMAADAGYQLIVPYPEVGSGSIAGLVQDTIFSRSPKGLARTAIFIGGRDALEAAELLDVDVDQLARAIPLVAADRLGGLERLNAVEAEPPENAADGGWRDPDLGGDLFAGPALAPQGFNPLDSGHRRRPVQPMWPRAAILQTGQASGVVAIDPFTHRARANACGLTDGLRRLPTPNHFDQPLSTKRRQAGILVDVHSALPRTS